MAEAIKMAEAMKMRRRPRRTCRPEQAGGQWSWHTEGREAWAGSQEVPDDGDETKPV